MLYFASAARFSYLADNTSGIVSYVAFHSQYAVKPAVSDGMCATRVQTTDNTARVLLVGQHDRVTINGVEGTAAVTRNAAGAFVKVAVNKTVHQAEIFNRAACLRIREHSRFAKLRLSVSHDINEAIGADTADGMSLPVKCTCKILNRLPQVFRDDFFPIRCIALVIRNIRAEFDGLSLEIVIFRKRRELAHLFDRIDGKLCAALIVPGYVQHIPFAYRFSICQNPYSHRCGRKQNKDTNA